MSVLVVLLLVEWGLLPGPVLDLSAYIEPRRDRYYDALLRVSTHGDWADWFSFFLEVVAEQARDAGVPVIPIPAGFAPRAAVAYLLVSSLEVAALCGAGPRLAAEVDVTASHLEQLISEWGPDAGEDARPREGLRRRLPRPVQGPDKSR